MSGTVAWLLVPAAACSPWTDGSGGHSPDDWTAVRRRFASQHLHPAAITCSRIVPCSCQVSTAIPTSSARNLPGGSAESVPTERRSHPAVCGGEGMGWGSVSTFPSPLDRSTKNEGKQRKQSSRQDRKSKTQPGRKNKLSQDEKTNSAKTERTNPLVVLIRDTTHTTTTTIIPKHLCMPSPALSALHLCSSTPLFNPVLNPVSNPTLQLCSVTLLISPPKQTPLTQPTKRTQNTHQS